MLQPALLQGQPQVQLLVVQRQQLHHGVLQPAMLQLLVLVVPMAVVPSLKDLWLLPALVHARVRPVSVPQHRLSNLLENA